MKIGYYLKPICTRNTMINYAGNTAAKAMKRPYLLVIIFIVFLNVSFSQMHTLYGVTLTITPKDTRSMMVSFKLVESDILMKKYVGINLDGVELHLSYINTDTKNLYSDSYHLTSISRIYENSSYSDWTKKVYLFRAALKMDPTMSDVDGAQLRIANWNFSDTNTILNVMYNVDKRKTVEMLSYNLTAHK